MRKTLQKVSVSTGNKIAWMLLSFTVGFAAGWVAAVVNLRSVYFPVI